MENSTIHGVRELVHSKHIVSKTMWVLFMATAAGMFGYHVRDMIHEYTKNPYTTDTSLFATTIMPNISFCPHGWASVERMDHYGIDHDTMLVLTALFPYDPYNIRALVKASVGIDNTTAKIRDAALQYNWRTIRDMGKAVIRSADDLIASVTGANVSLLNYYNMFGGCSSVNFLDDFTKNELSMMRLKISLRHSEFQSHNASSGYDLLFVGDSALLSDKLMLAPETGYVIYIKTTKYVFMPIESYPCRAWTMDERIECVDKCAHETWYEWFGCNRISFEANIPMSMSSMNEQCNLSHIIFDIKAERQVYDRCFNQCAPLCEKTVYSLTLNPLESSVNSTYQHIVVTMANVDTSVEMLQTPSYSFPRMVSNFGGILSLWFGASFLSLVQLVYLLDPVGRLRRFAVAQKKVTEKVSGV